MQTFDWGRPVAGAPKTIVHVGHDEIITECTQSAPDIQQILDNVKEYRNRTGNKLTKHGSRYMGEIPITVFLEWRREWQSHAQEHISEEEFMARKFNSSEYSLLRDGLISVSLRERG